MRIHYSKTIVLLTSAFCAIFFLAACNNGQNTNAGFKNSKIINGSEQDPFQSPQILKIDVNFTDSSSGFCTATVIGNNALLSAGHCFVGGVSSASIQKPDGSRIAVSQIIVHPQYVFDSTLGAIFNDVAVVKTAESLNLPPLGILASRQVEPASVLGVYGFGLDENGDSGLLKAGSIVAETITANHIIATFQDLSNPCNGDSGGPATYNILDAAGNLSSVAIAGIISTGSSETCEKGDVNLFTNLNQPAIISFISGLVPEVSLQ